MRAWAGWAVLVGVAVTLLAVAAPAQEEAVSGDVGRGGELYALHCAECHAVDGAGRTVDGVDVPALRGVSVAYVQLALTTQRMPPGDRAGRTKGDVAFSADDRDAIVAWMDERFGLAGDVAVPAEGEAARGREVFATHCAACHGATGGGGVAGAGAVAPPLVGWDEHTIARAIRVGPFDMPRFSEQAVSEDEAGDIAAYLRFVAEEPTTPVGFVELNPVFASAFVFLLALAVLLSCAWIAGRVELFGNGIATPEREGPSSSEAVGPQE